MPAWVKDEATWERAKKRARDEYPDRDEDSLWPVVTKIYESMGGRVASATKEKPAVIKSVLIVKAHAEPTITEPAAELASEHRRLVAVLRSPSHKDDKEEAERQAAELGEYEEAEKSGKSVKKCVVVGRRSPS